MAAVQNKAQFKWVKKYDDNENEYKNDKRMRLTGIKILKDSDKGKKRK